MFYIGSFYFTNENSYQTFQLIVDAESVEQAADRFKKKIQGSKNEIFKEMVFIHLKSIIEVKSISDIPVIINYENMISPFGHVGCDTPDSVENAEVHCYTRRIDGSHNTENELFIVLDK